MAFIVVVSSLAKSVISIGLGHVGWALGGILRKLVPPPSLPGPGLLVGRDHESTANTKLDRNVFINIVR